MSESLQQQPQPPEGQQLIPAIIPETHEDDNQITKEIPQGILLPVEGNKLENPPPAYETLYKDAPKVAAAGGGPPDDPGKYDNNIQEPKLPETQKLDYTTSKPDSLNAPADNIITPEQNVMNDLMNKASDKAKNIINDSTLIN